MKGTHNKLGNGLPRYKAQDAAKKGVGEDVKNPANITRKMKNNL